MKAYSELYLEDAKESLADCLDYAINDCKINADSFIFMFVNSKYAKLFSSGDPCVISGMSGKELARKIIEDAAPSYNAFLEKDIFINKSKEYWAGYYLAEYQWYTGRSFDNIFYRVSLTDIIDMYHPYHEMDVMHFINALNAKIRNKNFESKLKTIRKACKLSQTELSKKSGVSLRSIQMYEQRQNDIDKAQVNILYKLSCALHCEISDLLENINEK